MVGRGEDPDRAPVIVVQVGVTSCLYCCLVLELRAGPRRPPSSSRTPSRRCASDAEADQDREQPELADPGLARAGRRRVAASRGAVGGTGSAPRGRGRSGRMCRRRRSCDRKAPVPTAVLSRRRDRHVTADVPTAARAARARRLSQRRRESSIGPMDSGLDPRARASGAADGTLRRPRRQAAWLARNAVDCLPEGGLEAQARSWAAAAGQAGDRPDRARHPSRLHGRAPEAARVPGPRPHGRADHRRLHRAGGRSRAAARAPGPCSTRRRSTPTRAPSRSRR